MEKHNYLRILLDRLDQYKQDREKLKEQIKETEQEIENLFN